MEPLPPCNWYAVVQSTRWPAEEVQYRDGKWEWRGGTGVNILFWTLMWFWSSSAVPDFSLYLLSGMTVLSPCVDEGALQVLPQSRMVSWDHVHNIQPPDYSTPLEETVVLMLCWESAGIRSSLVFTFSSHLLIVHHSPLPVTSGLFEEMALVRWRRNISSDGESVVRSALWVAGVQQFVGQQFS